MAVTTRMLIRAGLLQLEPVEEYWAILHSAGVLTVVDEDTFVAFLSQCNDPDVAFKHFVHCVQYWIEEGIAVHSIIPDCASVARLLRVLGASESLGTMMIRRPELVHAVTTRYHALCPTNTNRHFHDILAQTLNYRAESNTLIQPVTEDEAVHHCTDVMLVAQLPFIEAVESLRGMYYQLLAAIMATDMSADDPCVVQPSIAHALADLASVTLEGALSIARHEVEGAQYCRFAVIGMGKLGARELNYVSDVDLIYVIEPNGVEEQLSDMSSTSSGDHNNADSSSTTTHHVSSQELTKIGTKLATTLQKVCMSVIGGVSLPALWQIDGGLRPEGKDGPLVRTVRSHREYYEKWAKNWEFQALLKARLVAGDVALGKEYIDMTRPMVWSASKRENFVFECQQMRKRVERLIPQPLKDREIKLGRGGLRDIEFTVQMLQLVHGRTDEQLRIANTLQALQALADGGYVSRHHAQLFSQAYRFERVLEHRLQQWSLRRTHLFPDLGEHGNEGGIDTQRIVNEEALSRNLAMIRLGRAVHLLPDALLQRYDETRRAVRNLHLELYYRPMLPKIAQLSDDNISLTRAAAIERFASIGFTDPESAMRHVLALTEGVSRVAKINRLLLPAVLSWLGEGQNPDMGILAWRRLDDTFRQDSKYIGFLRDSGAAAQRLCNILANSRYLGDALTKSADSITWLGDDQYLLPRTVESLRLQTQTALRRHANNIADFATSIRMLRRHEMERVGLAWMSRVIDIETSMKAMSDLYDACLDATLQWAIQYQCEQYRIDIVPVDIVLLGMGRYGGREVNFSSDADLIAVYRGCKEAEEDIVAALQGNSSGLQDYEQYIAQFARDVIDTIRKVLTTPITTEPKLELDFDLRPEGKRGPIIRSFNSTLEYYNKWAETWEFQALLRARVVAGDSILGNDCIENIINPHRYHQGSLLPQQIQQIRRLKARMESERLPRGVRRDRHLKLGAGGLSDVEWTVQFMQLQYATEYDSLRTTSTIEGLQAMKDLQLIDSADAEVLRSTWKTVVEARNANFLWQSRAQVADILPDDSWSLGGIMACITGVAHRGQQFENDILATMRRCRGVMERYFYQQHLNDER